VAGGLVNQRISGLVNWRWGGPGQVKRGVKNAKDARFFLKTGEKALQLGEKVRQAREKCDGFWSRWVNHHYVH